jgi:AcrR family transcriptional regulator
MGPDSRQRSRPEPAPDAGLAPLRLRRDAARNREAVLEAAAEVFAESGLNGSYDEIARRAGVGAGTVYRRFPERAELVHALFESQVEKISALAEDAAQQSDAWSALCLFLEQMIQMQTANRGFKEVLGGVAQYGFGAATDRDRLTPSLTALLDRAKRDGALRDDIEPADIGTLAIVLSSLSTTAQPELWRRYFTLIVEALARRPDGSAPLPQTPPAGEDIVDIIRGLRPQPH